MLINCTCGNVIDISPEYPICTICGARYNPQQLGAQNSIQLPQSGVKSLQDIISYLKMVSKLECSVHNQEKTRREAQRTLKLIEPEKEHLTPPVNRTERLLREADPRLNEQYPHYLEPYQEKKIGGTTILGIIGLSVLSIALVVLFLWSLINLVIVMGASPQAMRYDDIPLFMIAVVASGIVGFICIFALMFIISDIRNTRRLERKEHDELAQKYMELQQALTISRVEDQRNFQEYNARLAASESKYNYEHQQAKENYRMAKHELRLLKEPLEKTREILYRLYGMDIIFPKYQNMVAMTTIYEYFASGRVTELTGPHGAYNLYEQELRANIIIDKLDTIAEQLEQIKHHQYVLYEEMQHGNRVLKDIVREIQNVNEGVVKLVDGNNQIIRNTKIMAHYNEITAQNTEALKFLTLVTQ